MNPCLRQGFASGKTLDAASAAARSRSREAAALNPQHLARRQAPPHPQSALRALRGPPFSSSTGVNPAFGKVLPPAKRLDAASAAARSRSREAAALNPQHLARRQCRRRLDYGHGAGDDAGVVTALDLDLRLLPVRRSTLSWGRAMEGVGRMVTSKVTGMPLVMPPLTPPA